MLEEVKDIKDLLEALRKVGALLKKDTVVWPFQEMNINEFWRKYFPSAETTKEIERFKQLKPEHFLQAIENQLKMVDTKLGPLEDRMKALEFQQRLLTFFQIFAPNKLNDCQEILNRTPRGIREGFTTENILELAIEKGISQKNVAELMALWLNMRYYGAMSCGLSPKFLINSVKDVPILDEKLQSIEKTLNFLRPDVEKKRNEYKSWVFKKQRLDEERKSMTFGPEGVQTLEMVLDAIYRLSLGGELSQKEAMKVINEAKSIIEEAIQLGESEKKTLISKEKREKLEKIITEISEKPLLFFIIAQISHLLEKGEPLTKEHINTLNKIENVIKLLPDKTDQAVTNEELKKNIQLIFEPLKIPQFDQEKKAPEEVKQEEGKKLSKKKAKAEAKKGKKEEISHLTILKQIFENTSKWFLNRVIEEKKEGLETLLVLFNGIPLGLGTHISELIMSRIVKLDVDKFKECLIGYLSRPGVYELYSQLGKGRKAEAEIEVADEINIPPKADQRLAPLQKQLKFEFMKYIETAKLNNAPLFNIFESHQIPPIKFVDAFLEESQNILINIINFNADRKLHQFMKLNPEEYDVKLKTLNLKLSPFMNNVNARLEKVILEELKKKKFNDKDAIEKFNKEIEELWISNLIVTTKIEPKELEVTTDKVSALAAKLEGGIRTTAPDGARQGPPRAAPPSATSRPGPPSVAPASAEAKPLSPSTTSRPGPPRAEPPSAGGRAAPPSAGGTQGGPPGTGSPSAGG
ncbi:MAG TPA: hypothetical protein VMV49_00865, partial [Candidatus Deferrimicrobium sp.]|nr:hypothetical protein [Candidatus Deferrimicrobium sp.]